MADFNACLGGQKVVNLNEIANGSIPISTLVENVMCMLDCSYDQTKGVYPKEVSWYQFAKDTLPEEYYLVVKASLAASPALYNAVLTNGYAQNERDYFIKYPLLLVYIHNAVSAHVDQTQAINTAIFQAVTDFIDVWPLSPGGYVESVSDWAFRDKHAFIADAAEALPENQSHVDTRLGNDMLTRSISFLNSLVIKLKNNDVGLPEAAEIALSRSNFAALSNQIKQHILTEGSSDVQKVVDLPDGNKATIDAEGKIVILTPSGDKIDTTDESYKTPVIKKPKPSKTIDKTKVAVAVGGVTILATLGYFILKRNKS